MESTTSCMPSAADRSLSMASQRRANRSAKGNDGMRVASLDCDWVEEA